MVARKTLRDFWPTEEISVRSIPRLYLDSIRGRLEADKARSTSDEELERILGPCVCGPLLVELAKFYRSKGVKLLPTRPKRKPIGPKSFLSAGRAK